MKRWAALAIVAAAGCGGADGPPDGRVTVYAAASLGPAIEAMAALHEERTGVPVAGSFAASSVLAKQIEAGAPADVFISANPAWMDWLEEREAVEPGTRFDLAGNSLVIVAPAAAPFAFDGEVPLAESIVGRVALGDPDHVPAGTYARRALESAGWWEDVSSRVVGALDVRAALALVERGECDAGIVYASDAAGSVRARTVWSIPEAWHPPIAYPAAVVAGRSRPVVREFLETLRSSPGVEVLRRHGFRTAGA